VSKRVNNALGGVWCHLHLHSGNRLPRPPHEDSHKQDLPPHPSLSTLTLYLCVLITHHKYTLHSDHRSASYTITQQPREHHTSIRQIG